MSRGTTFIAAAAPFLALSTISLAFRLYTRIAISKNPGMEDAFVTISWIFAVGLFAIITWLIENNGLGKHILSLSPQEFKDFKGFLKGFWVGIFFYNFSLSACKASIFLQYIRLFQGWTKKVSWAGLVIIGINATWGFFINLFFCTPVSRFWNQSSSGHCLSRKPVWFSFAGANIATSIIIILVPIPAIVRLKLATRTKIALISIFGLGILDIVLAVLRLSSLRKLSNGIDVTYLLRDVSIWSSLESTVAIICASAPVLRPLVTHLWPRFFSTNKSTTEASKYGRGTRHSAALQPYSGNRASVRPSDAYHDTLMSQPDSTTEFSTKSLYGRQEGQHLEDGTFLAASSSRDDSS